MAREHIERNARDDRSGRGGRPLDPTALTVEELARMLGLRREMLEADLEAGAPRNPDGTLNLVHYAAWLNTVLTEEPDGKNG